MDSKKIRVLVAEDSTTVRELLVAMFNGENNIEVVGEAKNGIEAVQLTKRLKPDVITMDIQMPVMDGFAATKEIMIEQPTPIVIVSGHMDVREITVSMQALSAGALAVLPKPRGPGDADFQTKSRELIETIKAMSQVKVVRHWRERAVRAARVPSLPPPRHGVRCRAVAIGISTGGPGALHQILAVLPRDFPAPILVVQHITRGFVGGLAQWLNTVTSLKVKVAEDGEHLAPGTIYLAPDDRHLGVAKHDRVALSDAPHIKGFRPAVTHMFASVARAFGPAVVAVIMTGMGDDGVAGLEDVRVAGGRIVAQDEASSVVFGMPGAAIEAGFVDVVLPLAAIVQQLANQVYRE